MSTYYMISGFISLLIGVVTYLATDNFIFTGVGLVLSIIYFYFLANRIIKKYLNKCNRFHECYSFMNTFIISLSIKQSIKGAFKSTYETMPESFKNGLIGIESLSEEEKIQYLSKHFRFHIYSLFISLIELWNEQGGDILEMSSHLVNEARLLEGYISETSRLSKKHLVEFAILWLFSLSIIVILRFALSQFYSQIIKQTYYPFTILLVVVIVLVSTHIAISRLCKLDIRGWNNAE